MISGFPKLFLDFGVSLWEKAKVEVIKKGEEWIITEAIGEKNGGMRYIVRDIRGIQNGQNIIENMLVYTPDISPGWSDSEPGTFCRRL